MTATTRRTLLILVAALIAVIVAIVTTWLVTSTGTAIQLAMLAGGGAFGGTMTLTLLIMDKAGGFT